MNKLQIKKLGVLSVAKMYAAIMLVMVLLISIPYGLFVIGFSLLGASAGGRGGLAIGGGGVIVGLLVMIGLPIFMVSSVLSPAQSARCFTIFSPE